MDLTLERILSLLPHKPDGSLEHGAKAELARNLGYGSGDIVSMWVKGSSDSYKKKLHEIAAKYGVSVAWLKGETDEKNPAKDGGINGWIMTEEEKAMRERLALLDSLFLRLPPEEQERFLGRLAEKALSPEDPGALQ